MTKRYDSSEPLKKGSWTSLAAALSLLRHISANGCTIQRSANWKRRYEWGEAQSFTRVSLTSMPYRAGGARLSLSWLTSLIQGRHRIFRTMESRSHMPDWETPTMQWLA